MNELPPEQEPWSRYIIGTKIKMSQFAHLGDLNQRTWGGDINSLCMALVIHYRIEIAIMLTNDWTLGNGFASLYKCYKLSVSCGLYWLQRKSEGVVTREGKINLPLTVNFLEEEPTLLWGTGDRDWIACYMGNRKRFSKDNTGECMKWKGQIINQSLQLRVFSELEYGRIFSLQDFLDLGKQEGFGNGFEGLADGVTDLDDRQVGKNST